MRMEWRGNETHKEVGRDVIKTVVREGGESNKEEIERCYRPLSYLSSGSRWGWGSGREEKVNK